MSTTEMISSTNPLLHGWTSDKPNYNLAKAIIAPLTGDTVTIAATTALQIINPAGTLAVLTVNLPSSPANGQEITIASTQIITALTLANGTILGALTTLSLGGRCKYTYDTPTTTWYPS